jgi:hypothetical protein
MSQSDPFRPELRLDNVDLDGLLDDLDGQLVQLRNPGNDPIAESLTLTCRSCIACTDTCLNCTSNCTRGCTRGCFDDFGTIAPLR